MARGVPSEKETTMTRIIIVAVAVALAGTSAEAAARKKPEARALQSAAVAARTYEVANRPSWAAPGECFTDDGYGRFSPCSSGPCGK
jgi:hypothetical protein